MDKSRRNINLDFGKLPPQARDLEEAVLGAILLEADAMDEVSQIIQPACFYAPQNVIIYEAMQMLSVKGSPIDLLTVTQQLRKMGKLDIAGGAYYVTSLTNRVASSANIEYHARIVAQKFIQREIIRIASEAITTAFGDECDGFELLDKIDTEFLKLKESGTTKDSDGNIQEAISQVVKSFDEEDNKELSGIDFGNSKINEITGGAQKGDLILLAARPSVGKTARALKIAASAWKNQNKKGIVFSLEMTKKQLVQRLLADAADFSGNLFRNKSRATEADLKRLNSGANLVYEYGFEVYDKPSINSNFIRTAIKRFLKKHGQIDYIIIDYLQLMSCSEKVGNREQEISQISRALKSIAKEYDIPAIALSQLSRTLEQRSDKRPMLSDLRECLSTETSMIYTDKTFQSNVSSRINLLSLNKNKIQSMNSLNIPKTENIVYRLKTVTGRFIDCTLNHPILTTSGYKKLSEITKDDSIAIACGWGGNGVYIKESRFIGWMLGNGCMYGYNVPSFITNDIDISNSFCNFIQEKFGFPPKFHPHFKSKVYQWDITKDKVRVSGGNPCSNWLKENDLWGKKAKDKHIPDWFMQICDEKSICELIQGLWETDGSIVIGKKEVISYSTTSLLMANQILYLLAKIGIIASIDGGYKSSKATTECYKIIISSSDQKKKFIAKINLGGKKGVKLKSLYTDTTQSNFLDKLNRDTTVEISELLHKNKSKHRVQVHGNRRSTKTNLIKALKDHEQLLGKYAWIASDSIFWDSVCSITEIGTREIFDRSVPVSNNFVVNGIIVHNSGSLEQDADLVFFLYKPSNYYDFEQDPDYGKGDDDSVNTSNYKQLIENLIAKHRNGGGVGDVIKERFEGEFFRFSEWGNTNYFYPTEEKENLGVITLSQEALNFSDNNNEIPF
jgi:replicative DNA helicase